ncbi:MAG: baseplate J/gp47 family protein, partial [Alphaproteobacteria bacterium]
MGFQRPTLKTIADRIQADIAARLTGLASGLLRAVFIVLARAYAGAVHGLYGYLAWLARQLFPDTAEAEHLERHASIRGLTRLAATAATGNVTLTGNDGAVVPAGTELQRSDGVRFATDADATIASGTATATVTAVEAGEDGNTAAGAGLTFVSPVTDVDSTATVDAGGLTGAADAETDDELRARLLQVWRDPPQGGAEADYVAWAR